MWISNENKRTLEMGMLKNRSTRVEDTASGQYDFIS